VVTTRRDGDKAAIGRADIALAIVIDSPGRDRAIIFEAQAVVPARRDGDKAAIGRRDIALANPIVSPGAGCAIFF